MLLLQGLRLACSGLLVPGRVELSGKGTEEEEASWGPVSREVISVPVLYSYDEEQR